MPGTNGPGGLDVSVSLDVTSGKLMRVVLAPGTYYAYARLEDTSYRLRSKSIPLKVL